MARMYDRKCSSCDWTAIDVWEPTEVGIVPCPTCGQRTERAWLTKSSGVISDECHVWVKHGLCDAKTGAPVLYRSKSDMRAEAKRRGLESHVTHIGTQGGDRSKITTRWI